MGSGIGGAQDRAGTLDSVAAIRRFNRLYFRKMSQVRETFQEPEFGGVRLRILRELRQYPMGCTSAWLVYKLGIDPGQLSRILESYVRQGYIIETRRLHDRRLKGVGLSDKGWVLHNALERIEHQVIARMLRHLTADDRCKFHAALATVERLLELERPTTPAK
jgi:DNA-binding MarR family transcriptional regulator